MFYGVTVTNPKQPDFSARIVLPESGSPHVTLQRQGRNDLVFERQACSVWDVSIEPTNYFHNEVQNLRGHAHFDCTQDVVHVRGNVAALIIFLIGPSVARLLSSALTRSARNANLEYANVIGMISLYFLSLITIVIILAQLGVQTAVLTVILAVVLTSTGLATALALGFGCRAVISNILAGAFVRDHFPFPWDG